MTSIAIMQPTFLPWAGYFGLMDSVDEFVLLDHVQFDKRSWQQRNQIKTANGAQWLTVPVITKGKKEQAICDVQLQADDKDFPTKILKSIEQNYKKAPYYGDYIQSIEEIFLQPHTHLNMLNTALINYFRQCLGVATPVLLSSDMSVTGAKAALLVDICQKRQANHYLSPPGAQDYIAASNDFEQAGIKVNYFTYEHPEWGQQYGNFIPYMSVIDLLFNVGDKSMTVIRQGYVS